MPVSPMRPKAPPLNALRAFEAAARLGGFASAAEELCVTPGAISQHIRTLEDWTGIRLFDRRAHGVQLTPEGRRLIPTFTKAFDAMGDAVRDLRAVSPDRVLTIAALPSVAQLWLQPRLAQLRAALPDVNLSVVVIETPPNLSRDLFDLSLYMRPPNDCPNGLVLAQDALTPMCAPPIAQGLNEPADLGRATLLHDDVWHDNWARWSAEHKVVLPNVDRGPRFSLYSMAVEDAKSGAGVIMGHTALLGSSLETQTLVAPFSGQVQSPYSLVADVALGPFDAPLREILKRLVN